MTDIENDYLYSSMHYRIQHYNLTMSIGDILHQIKSDYILLDDKGSRNLVWKRNKMNLFIDSLIIGIPIPNIFLIRGEYEKLIIIDGFQRLKTIELFVNNEFKFNNFLFRDLDIMNQRRFFNSLLNITIVEQVGNNDDILKEIFYRINSGGEILTNQEFRNRLYYGGFLEIVKKTNEDLLWRKFYGKSQDLRFRDEELILFFFMAISGFIKNNLSSEDLNSFLIKNINNADLALKLSKIFIKTLSLIDSKMDLGQLKKNNRFNRNIFYNFIVPLGILVKKEEIDNIDWANVLNKVENNQDEFKSSIITSEKILYFSELIKGD